MQPHIRSPYDRLRVQQEPGGPSLTEQHHIANVDINNVVRKYMISGELAPPRAPATYADVTAFQADLASRYRFAQDVLDNANAARPAVVAARKAAKEAAKNPPPTPPAS